MNTTKNTNNNTGKKKDPNSTARIIRNLDPKISKINPKVEVLCLAGILGSLAYLAMSWSNIPLEVAISFDDAGNVLEYGSRNQVWAMVAINILLYLLLTFITTRPQAWNTFVTVTRKNADAVYKMLRRLIDQVKIYTTVLFTYMILTFGTTSSSDRWMIPALISLLLGSSLYSLYSIYKLREKKN